MEKYYPNRKDYVLDKANLKSCIKIKIESCFEHFILRGITRKYNTKFYKSMITLINNKNNTTLLFTGCE